MLCLAGSCLVSVRLVSGLQAQAVSEARQAADRSIKEKKSGGADGAGGGAAGEGNSGGKKAGGGGGNGGKAGDDGEDDDWGGGKKGGGKKGGGGKGKGGGKAAGEGVSGNAKGKAALAAPPAAGTLPSGPLAARVAELVLKAYPDMEDVGDGSTEGSVVQAVTELLLPACVAAYQEGLKAALTAGAEVRHVAYAYRPSMQGIQVRLFAYGLFHLIFWG